MPFDTRAAFKLTLAITAAISAQTLHAEESAERLWSCSLTPTGEWECDVNEALIQQAEPSASSRGDEAEAAAISTPAETAPTTPQAAESAAPEAPATAVDITPTTPAPAVPAPTAASTGAAPAALHWPQPERPATAQASARQSEAGWNCVADGERWQCRQPSATPHTPSTTPQPDTVQPQLAATGAPEWRCVASGNDWDCSQEAGAAPATAPRRTAALSPTPADAAALDWYPYAPGEAPGACSGRYVEPSFAYLQDPRPFDQQPIYVNALTSSTQIGGVTRLEGGVQIQRGGQLITSARGEFDQQARHARLFGGVRYREPGLLLIGEQAAADMISGDTRFDQAQYVLHQEHMRGRAKQITRFGDRRIELAEGAITYCEPGSDAWQIAASNIELDPNTGRGLARHATLDIAGVPVLYTPYLSFPIDDRRQSGFLYPSFGYSDSDGLDIAVPYYFNLAANFDDTLTPRYIGERGLLLENEFRYLNGWSHNTLSNAWLDDSLYGDDRWLFGFEHSGTPLEHLYSRIDFTRVSDDDYFEDLGTSLEVQRDDHLDQLFELRYLQPSWNLTLRSQRYQTIDGTTPYEKAPQLLLSGSQRSMSGLLDLGYNAEWVRFERDLDSIHAPTSPAAATVGDRLHLRPRLSAAFERPWGYLRPAAMFWHSRYELENETTATESSPSVSASVFSLDSGLIFERAFALADGQYTQTLEPRLLLLQVDADEQGEAPAFDSSRLGFTYYNLFHETGWSGNDRIADTSQATLGLSSAVYSEQGIEKLRVGIAQAHYFRDREAPALRPGDLSGEESSSNLATLANWNLTPHLRLTHNGEVDRDSYQFLEHNYKLSYLPGDRRLFYVNYRDNLEKYADNPTSSAAHQQLDIAFRWPLNRQWTGYGRWQQDLDASENLETLLGIEYASCCWKVRLTGRRWVVDPDSSAQAFETDNGIFLQFVLRGLGSFGQRQGREFLEEITGYDEDDNGAF